MQNFPRAVWGQRRLQPRKDDAFQRRAPLPLNATSRRLRRRRPPSARLKNHERLSLASTEKKNTRNQRAGGSFFFLLCSRFRFRSPGSGEVNKNQKLELAFEEGGGGLSQEQPLYQIACKKGSNYKTSKQSTCEKNVKGKGFSISNCIVIAKNREHARSAL